MRSGAARHGRLRATKRIDRASDDKDGWKLPRVLFPAAVEDTSVRLGKETNLPMPAKTDLDVR
jgi:hypothetical protein